MSINGACLKSSTNVQCDFSRNLLHGFNADFLDDAELR